MKTFIFWNDYYC